MSEKIKESVNEEDTLGSKQTNDVKIEDLQNKISELEAKAQENFDLMLRAKAEVENVRRRATIDIENAHKYGQEKFAKEMLAIVDSLQRGIESIKNPEDEAIKDIFTGMDLTFSLLIKTLDKFEIKQISKIGDDFDPSKHEALAKEESNEVEGNKILRVLQPGFSMYDRVLRPALVVIAAAPKSPKIDTKA